MTERFPASLFGGLMRQGKPGKRVARELPVHRDILAHLRRVLPSGTPIHHSPQGGDLGGSREPAVQRAIASASAKARSMGTTDGWPDIEFILAGRFYAIEVKSERDQLNGARRGYLSEDEKIVRDLILAAGGHYGVARSVEDVDVLLAVWGVER